MADIVERLQKEMNEAWQEHLDRDDRTSPEEYPEMALITQDEFFRYMQQAASLYADTIARQREEIGRLRTGWLAQAARDATEIIRLEVQIDLLREIIRGFLDCPEIADCAPDDKDPDTNSLERSARSALSDTTLEGRPECICPTCGIRHGGTVTHDIQF